MQPFSPVKKKLILQSLLCIRSLYGLFRAKIYNFSSIYFMTPSNPVLNIFEISIFHKNILDRAFIYRKKLKTVVIRLKNMYACLSCPQSINRWRRYIQYVLIKKNLKLVCLCVSLSCPQRRVSLRKLINICAVQKRLLPVDQDLVLILSLTLI